MDIFATKIGKQENNADFLCFDKSDKKQEDDFFKSFFKQRSI